MSGEDPGNGLLLTKGKFRSRWARAGEEVCPRDPSSPGLWRPNQGKSHWKLYPARLGLRARPKGAFK